MGQTVGEGPKFANWGLVLLCPPFMNPRRAKNALPVLSVTERKRRKSWEENRMEKDEESEEGRSGVFRNCKKC